MANVAKKAKVSWRRRRRKKNLQQSKTSRCAAVKIEVVVTRPALRSAQRMPWVTLGLWILISSCAVDRATSFSSKDQVFSFMHSMLSLTRSLWWTSTAPAEVRSGLILVFYFEKKNHWFARMTNRQTLHWEDFLLFLPPSNSIVAVSDAWRAFELAWNPSRPLT